MAQCTLWLLAHWHTLSWQVTRRHTFDNLTIADEWSGRTEDFTDGQSDNNWYFQLSER